MVLWGQVGVSFLAWVGYGVVLARRAGLMRERMAGWSRKSRTVLGPVFMVLGAVALFGSLALLAAFHGLTAGGMAFWAWALITSTGLVFVHAQSFAAVMMVSLAMEDEPTGGVRASEGRITDRNSDEAKTPSRS